MDLDANRVPINFKKCIHQTVNDDGCFEKRNAYQTNNPEKNIFDTSFSDNRGNGHGNCKVCEYDGNGNGYCSRCTKSTVYLVRVVDN